MQQNFGLEDYLFDVETVMAKIENSEPTECLEFTPIKGDIKDTFIIGEFLMVDTYENGDGKMRYSISFLNKDKTENDILVAEHYNIINSIVYKIVEAMETNV